MTNPRDDPASTKISDDPSGWPRPKHTVGFEWAANLDSSFFFSPPAGFLAWTGGEHTPARRFQRKDGTLAFIYRAELLLKEILTPSWSADN